MAELGKNSLPAEIIAFQHRQDSARQNHSYVANTQHMP